jgi:hypothetical protein
MGPAAMGPIPLPPERERERESETDRQTDRDYVYVLGHLRRFHLRTVTGPSLPNVMLIYKRRRWIVLGIVTVILIYHGH